MNKQTEKYIEEILSLKEEIKVLHKGIRCIRDLIESSEGVTGLHLNEDDAALTGLSG